MLGFSSPSFNHALPETVSLEGENTEIPGRHGAGIAGSQILEGGSRSKVTGEKQKNDGH